MSIRQSFLRFGGAFIKSQFSIILLPISWVWVLVSKARHFLYDIGAFRSKKVGIPVISIGNLAVGGTGKTPLVIAIAQKFSHKSVAILLRGYGKDEEYVLKKHLPKASIYANPNRFSSATLAIANGADMIILDDGFQHRQLARDIDIVIARRKDYVGRCLPAGDLREGVHRLKMADFIVLDTDVSVKIERILSLRGQEVLSIRGIKIGMFCGIGNPDNFKKSLSSLGAIIVAECILGDHEPIGEKRLQIFFEKCKSLGAKYLVCTEKDAVKLPLNDLPILFLEISLVVKHFEKLIAKIEERMYNSLN